MRRRRVVVLALVALAMAPWLVGRAIAGDDLPPDVAAAIRAEYASPDAETHYLAGPVDLNDDGKDEIIVHVVGMAACGSGGCPTLVFTPAGGTHRLVATITVSRAPIRAAATRTHGWRDLIVRVGGGGAKPHDVELVFDGTSYPSNPTVAGPRVTATNVAGAEVVVPEFSSFDDTMPLPPAPAQPRPPARAVASVVPTTAIRPTPLARAAASAAPSATIRPTPAASPAAPPPAAAAGASPSFECTKAASAAEKLVCRDAALAALDRKLDAAYVAAMRRWSVEEQARERAAQRAWLKRRDACGEGRDLRACVATAYRRRIVEVQIYGEQLEAPKPVAYVCTGRNDPTFTAAFYRKTEPPSAVVTFGDRRAIAFAVPAASGERYVGANVELSEHHGETTMTWSGVKYACRPRARATGKAAAGR